MKLPKSQATSSAFQKFIAGTGVALQLMVGAGGAQAQQPQRHALHGLAEQARYTFALPNTRRRRFSFGLKQEKAFTKTLEKTYPNVLSLTHHSMKGVRWQLQQKQVRFNKKSQQKAQKTKQGNQAQVVYTGDENQKACLFHTPRIQVTSLAWRKLQHLSQDDFQLLAFLHEVVGHCLQQPVSRSGQLLSPTVRTEVLQQGKAAGWYLQYCDEVEADVAAMYGFLALTHDLQGAKEWAGLRALAAAMPTKNKKGDVENDVHHFSTPQILATIDDVVVNGFPAVDPKTGLPDIEEIKDRTRHILQQTPPLPQVAYTFLKLGVQDRFTPPEDQNPFTAYFFKNSVERKLSPSVQGAQDAAELDAVIQLLDEVGIVGRPVRKSDYRNHEHDHMF